MKTCRSHHVPTKEEWAFQYKMIVPKTYRPDVLSTADETPLPGHLGVNKTCQRFLDHLYWLSLTKVVGQYCKSFHTCQMALKENYDVDAVESDFKSGEKALALLPVPRNKRNCKRFGPYVTEKKLNDLKS